MSESNVIEGEARASLPAEDDDFEPTADMMVHDYDDETTLNEDDEEDDIETNADELADLAKEGEMPLEQLLALYNYSSAADDDPSNTEKNAGGIGSSQNNEAGDKEDDDDDAPRRSLRSTSALLDRNGSDSESDADFDETAVFHEEEHKKPRIGEEYQVTEIPNVIVGGGEKYAHNDEQVWAPWVLPEDAVERYLKEIAVDCGNSSSANNEVTFIQDNEDALFLLTETNNDPEEALRRFKARPNALKSEINVWSEEECKLFEDGLTIYGKDFFMIHLNKVRTKSVRDIVKFYYIWKKSERYDQFTAKTRLGKKKENMQAGVTDYMDRLLDETDHVGSSSLLSQAGGNLLKYYTTAHSIALMEHLKQLEAEKARNSNEVANIMSTRTDSGDVAQNKTVVNSTLQSSSSSNAQQIHVNNSNNNTLVNTEPEINILDSGIYINNSNQGEVPSSASLD